MSHNATSRTIIWLSVLSVVATASMTCFAQWGTNASPYSECCPCVPARPWGYCQTRWHRWPGVMSGGMPVQAPLRGEGISPPQTELPSPGSEGESKTNVPSTEIPSETRPAAGPSQAPSNPFQPAPSEQPVEPAPQQAPEIGAPGANEPGATEPGATPPGTTGPGMEMPGTEPPTESPAPSDTNQPAPSESPAQPSKEESKPSEDSQPGPAAEPPPSNSEPGAQNMSPGLRLRRGDGGGAGRQARFGSRTGHARHTQYTDARVCTKWISRQGKLTRSGSACHGESCAGTDCAAKCATDDEK